MIKEEIQEEIDDIDEVLDLLEKDDVKVTIILDNN